MVIHNPNDPPDKTNLRVGDLHVTPSFLWARKTACNVATSVLQQALSCPTTAERRSSNGTLILMCNIDLRYLGSGSVQPFQ